MTAIFIAAIIESGFAIPLPVISKAVPCVGEVLIIGIPSVIFTPESKACSFIGMVP
ncbi:hypothetical protein LCGC14_2291000 [marine sediment metagenome]|uniref:Uncharacterized protein n=1 Tax=marine sediment metagenome TaxID=412755 RepID=A0A0F9CR84_9ZZZZ